MSEREMITVDVLDARADDDDVPETLLALPAWVAGLVESVPPEYRDKARVEFTDEGDYEWPRVVLRVRYERPETDAEMAARIEDDLAYEKKQEAAWREQYECLKAKFESP